MLFPGASPPYLALKLALERLNAELADAEVNPTALKTTFLEFQQYFQSQLLDATGEESSGVAEPIRSYTVEIDKQLRLLGIDLTFLQVARKSGTQEQRQQQIRDRLSLLLTYCDAVLELSKPPLDCR